MCRVLKPGGKIITEDLTVAKQPYTELHFLVLKKK